MRRVLGLTGLVLAMLGSVLVLSSGGAGAISNATCVFTSQGGRYVVTVNAGESFGGASLNFRDAGWIATGDPVNSISTFEIDLDSEPSEVVIRRGSDRNDVPCTTATGGLSGFTCSVTETNGGFRATVSADAAFGGASLNFRDASWIATGDPVNSSSSFQIDVNREPSEVIVRRGSDRADVPCTSGGGAPGPTPAFQCFAVDTGDFITAGVIAAEAFGDASINFRDNRWIATSDPVNDSQVVNARRLDRLPTTAIVRSGQERFNIPCNDDLLDGVDTQPPNRFLSTEVTADAVWGGNIVWGVARRDNTFPTFRFAQVNYLYRDGQDALLLAGGDNWSITQSEVLCGGRLLGFNALLTDDPGAAVGVVDPDAAVMFVLPSDYDIDSADCQAGVVTFGDGNGRTQTYEFDN